MTIAIDGLLEGQVAEQAAGMAVGDRQFSQMGVHCCCTDPDQHREIMCIEAFRRAHVDAGVGAQSLSHEVSMNRRRGKHHLNADTTFGDTFVGKKQFAPPFADCLLGFAAHAGDRCPQAVGARTGLERAVDLGSNRLEMTF